MKLLVALVVVGIALCATRADPEKRQLVFNHSKSLQTGVSFDRKGKSERAKKKQVEAQTYIQT